MKTKLLLLFIFSISLIGAVSACHCGDGSVNVAGEQCDLGYILNGVPCDPLDGSSCDYCSDNCLWITLYGDYCGDGIINGNEECDDGNNFNGDGCSATCQIEGCEHDVGVRYSYGNSFDTGIAIKLEGGDWISQTPAELTLGENYIVKYYIDNQVTESNNIHVTLTINGIVFANYNSPINNFHYNEVSIDTNILSEGSYVIILEVEKIDETDCNLEDNDASREILIIGALPSCGDGIVNGDEECDGQEGCAEDCTWGIPDSECGDYILEGSEECDWGTSNGFLCWAGYGESCQYCSSSCILKTLYGGYCGDDFVQSCEECDDGNIEDGDGCSSECELEDPIDSYCGDGIVNGDEECDGQEGCAEDCTWEVPIDGPICGNDIIEEGEECDDGDDNGNRCDNDRHDCEYCSNSCKIIEREEDDDEHSSSYRFAQYCEANWKCGGWGECENGMVIRDCVDTNKCGLNYNKPLEEMGCQIIAKSLVQDERSRFSLIIALLLMLGLVVFLTILANRK